MITEVHKLILFPFTGGNSTSRETDDVHCFHDIFPHHNLKWFLASIWILKGIVIIVFGFLQIFNETLDNEIEFLGLLSSASSCGPNVEFLLLILGFSLLQVAPNGLNMQFGHVWRRNSKCFHKVQSGDCWRVDSPLVHHVLLRFRFFQITVIVVALTSTSVSFKSHAWGVLFGNELLFPSIDRSFQLSRFYDLTNA